MGLGSVLCDILVPASVRLIVVLLIVVWPIVSEIPVYDGFLMCACFACYMYYIYDSVGLSFVFINLDLDIDFEHFL
jgi:hypothetical protein